VVVRSRCLVVFGIKSACMWSPTRTPALIVSELGRGPELSPSQLGSPIDYDASQLIPATLVRA